MWTRTLRASVRYMAIAVVCVLGGTATTAYSQDVKNSSDHPLFPNRMPGYVISNYQQQAFSSYKFHARPPQEIEGKYTRIHYMLTDLNKHPGGLAVRRNYENAVASASGEVLYSDDNIAIMKMSREGAEIWVELHASKKKSGRAYVLHIVERTPMTQVITADAMAAAIEKAGFVALDVHFATGKADVLPESQPLIHEIATMLSKKHGGMRVGIEGHTDNTGSPATNLALSSARAKSVVDALISAGIAGDRLDQAGFGQDRPIADNRTEEGRAKNRRVEIVKR